MVYSHPKTNLTSFFWNNYSQTPVQKGWENRFFDLLGLSVFIGFLIYSAYLFKEIGFEPVHKYKFR